MASLFANARGRSNRQLSAHITANLSVHDRLIFAASLNDRPNSETRPFTIGGLVPHPLAVCLIDVLGVSGYGRACLLLLLLRSNVGLCNILSALLPPLWNGLPSQGGVGLMTKTGVMEFHKLRYICAFSGLYRLMLHLYLHAYSHTH